MITGRRSTSRPVLVRSRFTEPVQPPITEQPAYIRKATATLGTAGTSITASFLTPTPLNRLLVAVATSADTLASAWVTPAGWSRGPEVAVSSILGTVLFYKIAGGGSDSFSDTYSDSYGGTVEPLSYTFDTGATSSFKLLTILEFSGNLTTAVFDEDATAADSGGSVTSITTGTTGTLAQADEISVAIASVQGLGLLLGGYDDDYSDAYGDYADTTGTPELHDPVEDVFQDSFGDTGTPVYQATYQATYQGAATSGAPVWGPWTNSYQSVSIQSTGDATLTTHNVGYRILSATDAQSSSVSWAPAQRAVAAIATFKSSVSTSRSGSVSVSGRGSMVLEGSRAAGSGGVVLVSESGGIQGTGMAVSSTVIQASPIVSVAQASSIRVTWPQATTPGNLLLAFVVATPNSGFAAPPTGWVPLTQAVQTGLAGQIFYIPNASGRSGDETFNLGSLSAAAATLMEVRGVVLSSPLDVQATSSGTSSLATTGQTLETVQDNEFWIGLIGVNGTTTFNDETNGFNLHRTASGTRVSMAVLDSPVASAGLASTSVALQTSLQWVGAVAAFKANPLDLGGGTFAGRASMVMGARGNGVLKAQGSGRADIVISARGGAKVAPPAQPGAPVLPPADAHDVVRKEVEELAILLTEPRVTYDFDSVRNVVEVLGAKPESGLKRVRAVAVAPRNHPLSPANLARNGQHRRLIEVVDTGLAVHRRIMPMWADTKVQRRRWKNREADRLHGAMVKRKKRAQEIANRRLDEFLRLSMEVETDVLPQPHLELGDLVLLKSQSAGRFEFRFKRGSLPLGSSSGMSIGANKRLRLLKKKRKKKKGGGSGGSGGGGGGGGGNNGRSGGKVGRQRFGWPDPR